MHEQVSVGREHKASPSEGVRKKPCRFVKAKHLSIYHDTLIAKRLLSKSVLLRVPLIEIHE